MDRRAIRNRTPPSNNLAILRPRPDPCNPQQRQGGGPSLSPPKGAGKGGNKGNNSNKNQKSAAIKVFSSGPAGLQPTLIKEGGKPATMSIGGKEVPIAWLCYDCHFLHHNVHKGNCRNCGADRQPTKEPTNFVRSKMRLEPPTNQVAPEAKAPAPPLPSGAQASTPPAKPKPPAPSPSNPAPGRLGPWSAFVSRN